MGKPDDQAIVGIAEHWNIALHVHDRTQILEHRFDARFVRSGERLSVGLAGEERDQQKIEHELLVRRGLLAIDAVGRILQQRFSFQNRLRRREPGAHAPPMRPGQGGDEQARRLSDEVVVGRRVKREVAAHEPCVLINRFQPALPEPDALRVFE